MTVCISFRERSPGSGLGHGAEAVRHAPDLAPVIPRGWQTNPVISPEAAAMSEVDYKSAERRPPERAKLNDDKRDRAGVDWVLAVF